MCVRERCVCVRERDSVRDRECVFLYVCERERERESVLCVCSRWGREQGVC